MPIFFDQLPPQRTPNTTRAAVLVARFNREVPIGATIKYYAGVRGSGVPKEAVVAEPGAFLLGGTAVVKVPGNSIALTHVEVIDQPATT